MTQEEEFSRWKISKGGFVIGVFIGLITLAIADAARFAVAFVQGIAQTSGSRVGLQVSSNLFTFVNGGLYIGLVAALIVVKIAHRTVKGPLEVRGPIKSVLGALTGVFYYFILAGGIITFAAAVATPAMGTFSIGITLLITLAILELSAAFKVLQGVLEFRDGRREAKGIVGDLPPPPAEVGGGTATAPNPP